MEFSVIDGLQRHLEELRQQSSVQEDGILIGSVEHNHVLAYFPLKSFATTNIVRDLELSLAGGLRVLGLYNFTASADDHLSRLARVHTQFSDKEAASSWLIMLHVSNRLSQFLVSTDNSIGRSGTSKPAKIRFQQGLKNEYRHFKVRIPLNVLAASSNRMEAAIRTTLDRSRALLTIDSEVISRQNMRTLIVQQIPLQKDMQQHTVLMHMVQPGVSTAVPVNHENASSPVSLVGTLECTALVHVSSKLLSVADAFILQVIRQYNAASNESTTQETTWDQYKDQQMEPARQRGYFSTAPSLAVVESTLSTTWPSFSHAIDAPIGNKEHKIKAAAAPAAIPSATPAAVSAAVSAAASTDLGRQPAIKEASSPSPAAILLVVGVVLLAVAVKFII